MAHLVELYLNYPVIWSLIKQQNLTILESKKHPLKLLIQSLYCVSLLIL